MSENKIFRKVALDRLSSPEELDQRLTVVSPIGWMALVAVGLLILAGLLWGIFGRISDKAVGSGIIISGGGITGVAHHAAGQVTDVSVRDGDRVFKGQVIARIEQTGLAAEINKSKENLAAAKKIDLDKLELSGNQLTINLYSQFSEIYRDYLTAQANVNTQKKHYESEKANNENELELAKAQYEAGLRKYNNYKTLYDQGAVSQDELIEVEQEYMNRVYNTKKYKLNELPLAQLKEAEAAFAAQKQRLKYTITVYIADLENNIQKMQRDLLNNNDVIAGVSGRVLEMKLKKGDMLQAGGVICTIAEENEQTDSLEAILYVPVEKGKRIIPGMAVNISPSTVKKEEEGFMLGNVVSVSEYPASSQRMALTLGNPDLVQQLSGNNATIEVRVKLIMDSGTISGYKWSTPQGPAIVIDDGTFCNGEVKVEQKRPISMIIPFIKKILPI
ncbi:NHLP bacteriocin system secretion protein [Desulforamulus aeronauticus]|uniref:HlyD family secretion protein n=1 Tax=Desulforamulus aeronauticus DSM 10349 TaxID=1121421 RepID=A0A1M6NV11_9FIRM|nr:NHLP bacteriocin system secretion protein [Desulforamulus aeronauticus]SHJ99482.1 HlyD family secretion protein [Desulforamulus aeronauticus DSM 10349]